MIAGSRWRDRLFALHVVVCLFAITWPGYAWLGNRVEPRVVGLPFSFAWIVIWVLLTFAALVAYHVTGPDEPDEPGRPTAPRNPSPVPAAPGANDADRG